MKSFVGAAVAVCVLAWAGAASAATVWYYGYGPMDKASQASFPAVGTPVHQTTGAAPGILDAQLWFRLADFTIDSIRISNATPGHTVKIGAYTHTTDYLGVIGEDGTFSWSGALTPAQEPLFHYTFFHINVGPMINGQIDYTSAFDLDEFTFSGTIPSVVPEPATWAMMIIGFGLAGSTLRVRRTLYGCRQSS